MDLQTFLQAVAYIFPAYVSNATPVVVVRLFGKPHPIDCGLVFIDGRRLLGDGKTVEGFFSGTVAGIAAGVLMSYFLPSLFRFVEVFFLSFGAMVGDVFGAFIKRRLGLTTGKPAPVMDQLSFLVVALALVHLVTGLPIWLDTTTLIALMPFTILMHLATNTAAYLLKLKSKWY